MIGSGGALAFAGALMCALTLVYDRIWCGVRQPAEVVRMRSVLRGVALGCVAVGGIVAVVGFFV